MSALTVAVTGSTGFVGRYVVRTLLERGHRVRALVRDPVKESRVLPRAGVVSVKGDANDAGALADLVSGCDAVIHLIGIRREAGAGATYQRLHIDATRSILEATREAGVRRYAHMSALGVRPEARSGYHRSKFEAEMLVRRSGLNWTIFRPSVIHGPDGEFMQMVKGWVTGSELPKSFLPYFARSEPLPGEMSLSARVQPVSVEDVAGAFAESLTSERMAGEIYCLGGPRSMTWPELLEISQDAIPHADPNLKPRGISGEFACGLAKAAGVFRLGGLLPFGPDEPLMAIENNTCLLTKPEVHFGFAPRDFESSLREYAGDI